MNRELKDKTIQVSLKLKTYALNWIKKYKICTELTNFG